MGKFSSDRSIRDYCRDIWDVQPVNIDDIDQNKECITEQRSRGVQTGQLPSEERDNERRKGEPKDRTMH
ncbi:hypothetical protein MNBD_GAMMA13-1274 [hydrothermal vent metagenome]|uniref:Glycogen phosphorylase n=1 Tax=hydrothermal vent metagenome TaxID=652676 RepID=A0A3B0YS31_9ZZZZ